MENLKIDKSPNNNHSRFSLAFHAEGKNEKLKGLTTTEILIVISTRPVANKFNPKLIKGVAFGTFSNAPAKMHVLCYSWTSMPP